MPHYEIDQVYLLYCEYASQLRIAAGRHHCRSVGSEPMLALDFAAAWRSLSRSRREFWWLRFEAGYSEIAAVESEKLNEVFADCCVAKAPLISAA